MLELRLTADEDRELTINPERDVVRKTSVVYPVELTRLVIIPVIGQVDLGLLKPEILTKTVEMLDDETPNLIET